MWWASTGWTLPLWTTQKHIQTSLQQHYLLFGVLKDIRSGRYRTCANNTNPNLFQTKRKTRDNLTTVQVGGCTSASRGPFPKGESCGHTLFQHPASSPVADSKLFLPLSCSSGPQANNTPSRPVLRPSSVPRGTKQNKVFEEYQALSSRVGKILTSRDSPESLEGMHKAD